MSRPSDSRQSRWSREPTTAQRWIAGHGRGVRVVGWLFVVAVIVVHVLTVLQGEGTAVTWFTSVSNSIAFAFLLAVGLPQLERHVATWDAGHDGGHAPDADDRPTDVP